MFVFKNDILKEIKSHIRGSAEREASLMREIDELNEKVRCFFSFITSTPYVGWLSKKTLPCLRVLSVTILSYINNILNIFL